MYQLAYGALGLTLLVNMFFGLTVLVRVYQKTFGRYFVSIVLGLIVWTIGVAGVLFSRDYQSVHFFAELFVITPMVTPIFIWFFSISFPDDQKLPRVVYPIAAIPFLGLTYGLLWHYNTFIKGIQITNGLNTVIVAKPGYYVYSAYFSLFFVFVYIALWLKMRRLEGISRTQVRYVLTGYVLIGSVLALITNLSLPSMGIGNLIWLGPFFTLFFPISVAIAIVRHRLFDIRWYTVRSVAYVLTFLTAAVFYAIPAVLLSTYILHAPLHASTIAVLAAITLIVSFFYQSVRRFFNRITNKFFYQDAYDSQAFISALNRALVSSIELDKLLANSAQIIQENIKTEYCLIGVGETKFRGRHIIGTIQSTFSDKDIDKVQLLTPRYPGNVIVTDNLGAEEKTLKHILTTNNIAVLVRITSASKSKERREGIGYIVLGPKKSGNPYSVQDVNVLDIISRELFIAIQNALHFEEIQQFNETLQERIEDATRKLRNTNDKLRTLDQTKDDFISMASHQLRTPLTSVKGYVSMVLDGDAGPINPMQRKLLDQSFASSQRMVYLIADLLNISRLKTGRFVIEPSPTNLAQITKDEVSQLIETAKSRGLELTYDRPQDFPVYMLDTVKIRQVIMNFVDNAIYYTKSGGHIHVKLVNGPKTIELKVIDDGIGVPKALQHHLFSKFYRAPNAQKARPDGTGLGLFMAKKVIVAQGGAVVFESTEGKGSVFGFSFSKSHLEETQDK